jgi:hypothetical protein
LISEDADTRKAAIVAAKKLAEKRFAASSQVKQLEDEAESLGLVGRSTMAGVQHTNLGLQAKPSKDVFSKKVFSTKLMVRLERNLRAL